MLALLTDVKIGGAKIKFKIRAAIRIAIEVLIEAAIKVEIRAHDDFSYR